jgi:hypothetical protein
MKKTQEKSRSGRLADLKVVPLNIRVAATEKAAFDRAAEVAGVPLSAWMRERLRTIARRELQEAGEPVPFLKND